MYNVLLILPSDHVLSSIFWSDLKGKGIIYNVYRVPCTWYDVVSIFEGTLPLIRQKKYFQAVTDPRFSVADLTLHFARRGSRVLGGLVGPAGS